MKFVTTLNGCEKTVSLNYLNDFKLEAVIDGVPIACEYSCTKHAVTLKIDCLTHHFDIARLEGANKYALQNIAGSFFVEAQPEREHRLKQIKSLSSKQESGGQITSPMPGKIVQLLKKVGDSISAGDPILVVEAMKMQNEVKSKLDGTISAIKVNEGEAVEGGDLLVEISQ